MSHRLVTAATACDRSEAISLGSKVIDRKHARVSLRCRRCSKPGVKGDPVSQLPDSERGTKLPREGTARALRFSASQTSPVVFKEA